MQNILKKNKPKSQEELEIEQEITEQLDSSMVNISNQQTQDSALPPYEQEEPQENEQIPISLENNNTPMSQKEKLLYVGKKLTLFCGLVALGNYCYFGPEKACDYESDEDCLKYFVEPIKQYWAVTGTLSCISFFLVVFLFLVKDPMLKILNPSSSSSYSDKNSHNRVHRNSGSEFPIQHHTLEENNDSKYENFTVQTENIQHQESKKLLDNTQESVQDIRLRFKKYEKILGVVALINQICIQLFASKYIDPMNYHGVFKFAFTMILCILWFLLAVVFIALFMYKKFGRKCLIACAVIAFTVGPYIYYEKVVPSCDHWLEGTYMNVDQDSGYCNIVVPNHCWFNVMGGIFDFNTFSSPCNKRTYDPDYDYINRYIANPYNDKTRIFNKEYKYIGYPDTSKFSPEERRSTKNHLYSFQKQVLDKAVFYKTLSEAKAGGHEQIVDIENQEAIYNLKKNDDLVKERKSNNSNVGVADNIIVIFIDAVSRRNAYRQLPKTVEYLSRNKDQFYEYFRYHALRRSTAENLLQFFYNSNHPMQHPEEYENQDKNNKRPMIFEKIKEQGYITMHASDLCQTKSLQFGGSVYEYFQNNAMDHEGFGLACHPKHQNPQNPLGMFEGPNSTMRRCFLQKDSFQHVFDYSLQFRDKYRGEKTFQYLEFLDAHEASSELLKYMDEQLADYLEEVDDGNSLIMLVSDHGHHMSEWTVFSPALQDQLHLEMALPMLFLKTPSQENDRMSTEQQRQLKRNQQKMFTMGNLYHTLREATGISKEGEREQNMPSLFEEMDSSVDCMNSNPRLNLTGVECACRNPF